MSQETHISQYDYHLPQELIAQAPLEDRDAARLLVLQRQSGGIAHSHFRQLGHHLPPGTVIVLNNTRVIPARLYARKPSGGKVEILLVRRIGATEWEVFLRGKVQDGGRLEVAENLTGYICGRLGEGRWRVRFEFQGDFFALLEELGYPPLPPYIKRRPEDEKSRDKERYQTVYAAEDGSIAAPTAGLHFTRRLLDELRSQGFVIVTLTLHVGPGTFVPVRSEDIREHKLEPEYYRLPLECAEAINRALEEGRRILAVGTSTLRALESARREAHRLVASEGWSQLFIYPGYTFSGDYALLTNFHLPRSTNLMLVAALAGREKVLEAYREAVNLKYRFYSYGDAMLVI